MQCPKCQFENRDGAIFCRSCGTSLEIDISCSNCKASNPPDSKFCEKCGQDLQAVKKTTPIKYSEPQSYTPKFLADKILTGRNSIEGERKLVTVLFADVANYTAMSEKLDPEEVHQIMEGCFKILMDEIHKFEGTINQFTGDGIMAIFGAPVAHEDHAQRACYAALSIRKAIIDYGEKVKKEFNNEFMMRIGINSGPVVVGSIGDDLRMDYTAVGDTTNMAARMEGEASPGCILVTKNAHKITKDFFEFKSSGMVEVKGKEEPQESYELIKSGEIETRIKASVVKGLTKFVGRKNSMAALKDTYEKMLSSSGKVIGVVGEAGVGKSRLLLEFISQLPYDGVAYLEGRCLHYGESIIYMPILEILKSYFDIKEDDREFIINKKIKEIISRLDEKLEDAIPPFQDLLSLKVEDEVYLNLESKQKRERIFEALRDLFIRASQKIPVVLVFEDLHWIDKTSEEFLDYLIEWLANARIMLILLYRPEYTHHWGSKSYYTKIGLTQLGAASSIKLVQSILEEGEIIPDLEQLILNRGAGNPLFMEELTYSLLENGTIQKKDQKYILTSKTSDIQVPDTIQGIIAARMDRLEENLKRTMQVASVIGREFTYRILQTVSGMRAEIKSYLLNLQGLEFIYEKSLFPELEYIFKHALTQEVAYNSLLLTRRKKIHEKIGNAIEELYSQKLEEYYEMLSYHYSNSDNVSKAYQYSKLAGNKTTRNNSIWEAFHFYRDALESLNKFPEAAKRKEKQIEVILLMESPMKLLNFPEDSLKILQKGEEISKELNDTRSLSYIYRMLGNYFTVTGDPSQGVKYTDKCFREASKIQDVELMAPTALELCLPYDIQGKYLEINKIASNTINLIEKTKKEYDFFGGPFNLYSILCALNGFSLGSLGYFKEGKIYCEKSLNFAHKINNITSLAASEVVYGLFYTKKGDGKSALPHYKNSIRYCEEGQVNVLLGLAWAGLGHSYLFLGEIEIAKKNIEKGIKIQRDVGAGFSLHHPFRLLAETYFELGDMRNSMSCTEKAIKISKQQNSILNEMQATMLMARILVKLDRSNMDEAEEYILNAIQVFNERKVKAYVCEGYYFLGELFAEIDKKEKASEYLNKAKEMFNEMDMPYWLNKTKKVLLNLNQ